MAALALILRKDTRDVVAKAAMSTTVSCPNDCAFLTKSRSCLIPDTLLCAVKTKRPLELFSWSRGLLFSIICYTGK
jgi:hypothetical protein